MENGTYYAGGNFTITKEDGRLIISDNASLWSLTLSDTIAMAVAIESWYFDEDGNAIDSDSLSTILYQIFFSTTIPGDAQYIKDRSDADAAYVERMKERMKEIGEKDVAAVTSIAMEIADSE